MSEIKFLSSIENVDLRVTLSPKEKMRQSKLGRLWFTNGIESKLLKSENAPLGWKNGRTFYINKDDINNNQAMI